MIGRLTWPSERVAAAACLLPRVVDPENFDSIVGYELPAEEQEQLDDRLGISRRLDKKNLTGHYELDLAHTVDAVWLQCAGSPSVVLFAGDTLTRSSRGCSSLQPVFSPPGPLRRGKGRLQRTNTGHAGGTLQSPA